MKRCFVALALPDTTAIALSHLQTHWDARPPPRCSSTLAPRANLHLTLKFFGPLDETKLTPLTSALARVAAVHAPIDAEVAGIGVFGGA